MFRAVARLLRQQPATSPLARGGIPQRLGRCAAGTCTPLASPELRPSAGAPLFTVRGLTRLAPSARGEATAAAGSEWHSKWKAATAELTTAEAPFEEASERLRALVKTGLLRFTDLRDEPERFFLAHRMLGEHAVPHGPGFFIRFTVQYNLFAGTVLAVGSESQVAQLDEMQRRGQLGCFALTEKLAGVQSGLVVNTTAHWHPSTGSFTLHTPSEGAKKNWISQGFTADKAVVMASLFVDGRNVGPHAFLVDLRGDDGRLLEGVEMADMGRKTTGNDLDNAWIAFDHVQLPRRSLLDRYCDIVGSEYVLLKDGMRPFDMIGQRLYTGRVAVAQAALEYRRALFQKTKRYTDSKQCPSSTAGETFALGAIPQLVAIYDEEARTARRVEALTHRCEVALNKCLRDNAMPSAALVDAIATCKVRAVESSIDLCFRLKQEVGSYALMDGSGFKHMDFLQCCKFAEGDSRILMQKLARDTLKRVTSGGADGVSPEERQLAGELGENMVRSAAAGKTKQEAWDDSFGLAYALAEASMQRIESSADF